VACAA